MVVYPPVGLCALSTCPNVSDSVCACTSSSRKLIFYLSIDKMICVCLKKYVISQKSVYSLAASLYFRAAPSQAKPWMDASERASNNAWLPSPPFHGTKRWRTIGGTVSHTMVHIYHLHARKHACTYNNRSEFKRRQLKKESYVIPYLNSKLIYVR